LLASGDRDRDLAPATEELELSRRWDSPRALGVSLRVLGLAEGGAAGMDLARESVATLERSGARGGARARTRSKPA
jgi:hypothetical protein